MNISKMRIALQHVRPEQRVHKCPFNPACACEKKLCEKCGWNPVVSHLRTEAIENQWRKNNGG